MASEKKSFIAALSMLIVFCLLLFLIYLPQPEKKRVEADLNDCGNNLKQIHRALLLYQEKYSVFPHEADTKGLNLLFELHFDRDLTHFVCPGTETQTRGELRDDTLSYYYFPPAKGVPAPNELILADHPGNHPGGQIRLLYGDGSVKTYRLDKPVPRNELPAKVK